jgi:O-antigen ligase
LATTAHPLPTAQFAKPVVSLGWLDPIWEAAKDNHLRRIFLWVGLVFIFLRFTLVHEVVSSRTGINLHIVLIVGIPTLFGVIFSGGIARTFRHRIAWLWLGFLFFIAASTPFSVWRGGSLQSLITYAQTQWPMLLVTAGLVATWKETQILIKVMTGTAFFCLIMARILLQERYGRLELDLHGGSISNPNDLAAHLLLLIPFILLVAFDPARNFVLRGLSLAAAVFGAYIALGSGSRGAMVSLGVMILILLYFASGVKRLLALVTLPVVAVLIYSSLSPTAQQRLFNFNTSGQAESIETQAAVESARARKEILLRSIRYTLENPFLGVGLDVVNIYDDQASKREGRVRGHWLGTHNAYTMVSSECGIPALLCFAGALLTCILTMAKLRRACLGRPELAHIQRIAEAMILSQAGYYVAITFLTVAYSYTLPAMGGLTIAVAITAWAEIYRIDRARQQAQAPAGPQNLPPERTPLSSPRPQPQLSRPSAVPLAASSSRLNPKFGGR